MVSFFGLKVGGKKKKSDTKSTQENQPQQWKRIDQNALGEGQFFGQNINQKGAVNGSLQSASRAGTPQPRRSATTPYTHHDTHNLAASSMFDLRNVGSGRPGSQASHHLKPHASDMNMRTRFAASNGSSSSLAAPSPAFGARFGANNASSPSLGAPTPGFGARFGAGNMSSSSLAAPGPGFGSRPGTPSKTKAWVNPLDVHFARSVPSGPPTPKSPLVVSPRLPPTPTEKAETGSVFGQDADDMVDAVMSSVKKEENEKKEAKRREEELEKQRETARLEMERLERQKSTESTLTVRRPSVPQLEPEPQQKPPNALDPQGPPLRGDLRPGSRGGPVRPPPLHQGPPPTGPPTHCLPQPPGQGPPRHGPLAAGQDPGGRVPRPAGAAPQALGPGSRPNALGPQQSRSHSSHPGPPHDAPRLSTRSPQGSPQKTVRLYRPPPLQGFAPLGPLPDQPRSPSLPLTATGISDHRSQTPVPRSPLPFEHRPAIAKPEPQAPVDDGRGTPAPENQEPARLISTLASPPSTVTSPSGSIRRMSLDDDSADLFARPVIRNVEAKRDTLTFNTPRQHSLSMRIEELEKTLLKAQQLHQTQNPQTAEISRASTSSSIYSDGIREEDEDDDGPILSIQPAPLRIPSPLPPVAPAAAVNRPQSPMRGPPRRGPLPRRPGLEEYGVSSSQVAIRSRGGTPTPASRSGSTDNYSTHSSPLSQTDTSQLRHPNWKRDLNQASPAPTLDSSEPLRPSPVVDTGFKFDFGPSPGIAPPTPDSTTWSLASPTVDAGVAPPPLPTTEPAQTKTGSESPAKFTRANVPPPLNLKFNFSPDAPSRDPTLAGLWTPPIRSHTVPMAGTTADGRPSTSSGPPNNSGSKLAASPSLISKFPESLPRDDDDPAAFMGIGMARGPSIRKVRRPKTAGGRPPAPEMVDSFGTGFI